MASALVEAGTNHRVEDVHVNIVDNRNRSTSVIRVQIPPNNVFQVRDIDIVMTTSNGSDGRGVARRRSRPGVHGRGNICLIATMVKRLADTASGR